ncbi:hypothetical protein N0V94_007237 [Neodidymelliopsis sp. IMI 364377]|nr:hypothetical protein N0V94_007237 [Neodidymelliopsis sp. IMI 364377]
MLLSHFRGVRHREDDIAGSKEPLANFEPWAASLRELALSSHYKPLEDTSEIEQLFNYCFEDRLEDFKFALQALRRHFPELDFIQPIAYLAAQRQNLRMLQYCFEEGAAFDRYLNRAAQIGARSNVAFLEFLLEKNWFNIQHSQEAIEEQIKHYGDDSIEAKWLRTHAGKGAGEKKPVSKSEALDGIGNNQGRAQSKDSEAGNPKQGHTPEQIQDWFSDVPW